MITASPIAPASIQQTVEQVLMTRRITRADQQCFMMAALSTAISYEEHTQINRVFDALQRGFLKVVD